MTENRKGPDRRRISERRSFDDRRQGLERLFDRSGHSDDEIRQEATQWVHDMDQQLEAERRARAERRDGDDRRSGKDRRET